MLDLKATFEKYHGEFLKFDRILNPLHKRPDLCAFLMLDALVPGKSDMVSAAEHDEIFLAVTPDELAETATEETVRDLHRCGVRYDTSYDSLAMFV